MFLFLFGGGGVPDVTDIYNKGVRGKKYLGTAVLGKHRPNLSLDICIG
jgi:hypothetical protein